MLPICALEDSATRDRSQGPANPRVYRVGVLRVNRQGFGNVSRRQIGLRRTPGRSPIGGLECPGGSRCVYRTLVSRVDRQACALVPDSPEFTALQLLARSVLLNTPSPAPANTVLGFCGSIASDWAALNALTAHGRPEFAALQLAPPLVDHARSALGVVHNPRHF